jgi:hypothetical protein
MYDLVINPELARVLPALSDEELAQLEANLVEDGRVIDPILWFNLDGKRTVLDGMNRFPIAQKHGLPFREEERDGFADIGDAKNWIRKHQLGRRNLLNPAALRKLVGEWYNDLKRKDGGHGAINAKGKAECQVDTPLGENAVKDGGNSGSAAATIGVEAGLDERTVRRAGKFAEALEKLPPILAKQIETGEIKHTEPAVIKLASCDATVQGEVARDMRVGKFPTLQAAMESRGLMKPKGKAAAAKPPAVKDAEPDRGKCPNCAGTKWTEDEDGAYCSKCRHPHGEPVGDVDDKRIGDQRSKTIKTAEALLRAFDDLHTLMPKPSEHKDAIAGCKALLKTAREWKVKTGRAGK